MKPKGKDFQEVQNALRLKRHEQPPPRFFSSFSEEVIGRINTPSPAGPKPWYERLGFGEDYRPLLLAVLGIAVCVAVVMGLVAALKMPPPDKSLVGQPNDPNPFVLPVDRGAATPTPEGFQPLIGTDGSAGSTTPVMAPNPDGTGLGEVLISPNGNRKEPIQP